MPLSKRGKKELTTDSLPENYSTPYDHLIPSVEDPSANFYLDLMRIYLAIYSGTLSLEDAVRIFEKQKSNPESVKVLIDPTIIPLRETYIRKILSNLETLQKYELKSLDAIRSAFNFAFLMEESPISPLDLDMLKYFLKNPLSTISKAASMLSVASRTVSRALKRLRERHSVRFQSLHDPSAFGVQSALFFFRLQNTVSWDFVEDGLARFPHTKSMLKTPMSDYGYATFMFPYSSSNLSRFLSSIEQLQDETFEHTSVHLMRASGTHFNMDLFSNEQWRFPDQATGFLHPGAPLPTGIEPSLLYCKGRNPKVAPYDFEIISQYRLDIRASPSTIQKFLSLRNIEYDVRYISRSIKRCRRNNLLLPNVSWGSLGLPNNFCFEILCNGEWVQRITHALELFPNSLSYISDRGIVIWIQVPGYHQVDYYQMIRNLERYESVESVESIMTLKQKGSRSTLDLLKNWRIEKGEWTTNPDSLDLGEYIC
ncbi:MAG: hypothetical protein BAJATHORv1_90077 [Candidatus Thorarchaeota archaeon]|nr:MAG: hypothetical protein BAJATHORv1_90077 [Candidatus Thorarchaeota archaeon]